MAVMCWRHVLLHQSGLKINYWCFQLLSFICYPLIMNLWYPPYTFLACHWRHNVFPDSPLSIHSMQDAGRHHFIVQRPLKGCQSCLIIVSVNLICACEDKIWPLLYVIVWLTCLIHDTDQRWEQQPPDAQNSMSVLKYSISFFLPCIFLLFPPFHPSFCVKISDLCFMRDDPSFGVLKMVTVLWNGMINNKRKVTDRDQLVYDYTSQQQIYGIPTETAAWLGSFTEATAIQASYVICLDNVA